MRFQLGKLLAVGAALMLLAGCSDTGGLNLARVKGTVFYKDQPVQGASVTFVSPDGQIANGTTDASGVFTLTTAGRPGAVVGQHQVGITKMETKIENPAELTPEDMMRMAKEQGGTGSASYEPKHLLPPKYALPAESGLTASVVDDESQNEFEFRLVD